MRDLTTLVIAALAHRFPNIAYLAHLQFLQRDFWQLDQLDTRETIKPKQSRSTKWPFMMP
jgi:hypothetical protein